MRHLRTFFGCPRRVRFVPQADSHAAAIDLSRYCMKLLNFCQQLAWAKRFRHILVPACGTGLLIALGHTALNIDSATHGVDDANELYQNPVSGGLNNSAAMFGDPGIDQNPCDAP